MRGWIFGLFAVGLSGCHSVPPLVVASDLSNRPFAFVEGDTPSGFEPELIALLGAELGRPIQWRRMEFSQLIEAVEKGDVDLACATMGVTPERAGRVAFTVPYYRTEIAVVVLSNSRLRTITDLAGQDVGAARGTTSERALRVHAPAANAVLERKEGVTFSALLTSGALHAAAMDGPDAQRMVAAEPTRFRRLGSLSSEEYSIVVSRQRPELLGRLNRALAAVQADGRVVALLERHKIPASANSGGPRPRLSPRPSPFLSVSD